MPIMISIIVAIDMENEEKRNLWSFLKQNNVNLKSKILGKFFLLTFVFTLLQFVFFSIFIVIVLLLKLQLTQGQFFEYFRWTIFSILGGGSLTGLQILVSRYLVDFSKQIIFGVIGTIFNFVILLLFEPLQALSPFSQISIGLRTRQLSDFSVTNLVSFIAINFVMISLFLLLTVRKIYRSK
jgi:ABC-2 type transport system permease protein